MSVSRKKGFTLVEVSVVMLIGALLTFSGVKGMSYFRESYNKKITEHRLDEIEKALLLYLQSKRSMPCPASLVAEVNSANFGRAMKYNYTVGSETYQMCGVSATDIGDLVVGTQGQSSGCNVDSGYASTYPMLAVGADSNNVLCSVPVYGAVPVVDLGLPNEYAFDADNNRIGYVIGTGAVQKPLLNSDNTYRKQTFCAENHVGKKTLYILLY